MQFFSLFFKDFYYTLLYLSENSYLCTSLTKNKREQIYYNFINLLLT